MGEGTDGEKGVPGTPYNVLSVGSFLCSGEAVLFCYTPQTCDHSIRPL